MSPDGSRFLREPAEARGIGAMRKALTLILSDAEILELQRILLDRDEAGALAFLDDHLKKQVAKALEGG